MKKQRCILPALALLLAATACKPTEANYKAAYDAALNRKAHSDDADRELGIAPGQLITEDGPLRKSIGGRMMPVLHEHIRWTAGTENARKRYNLAVASFKMPTNVESTLRTLLDNGYPAWAGVNAEGRYYVFAASFDSPEQTAAFADKYVKEHKDFIGLPGEPVVIER